MTLHRHFGDPDNTASPTEEVSSSEIDDLTSSFLAPSYNDLSLDPTISLARVLRFELKTFCSVSKDVKEPRIGFIQPPGESYDTKNMISAARELGAITETLADEIQCDSPEMLALKKIYQECYLMTQSLIENIKEETLSSSKAFTLREQLPEVIRTLLKYELVCETVQSHIAEKAQKNLKELERQYLQFFTHRDVIRA